MSQEQAYKRLFCFGMPKCGTTTVAALLNTHPAICLHSQKEPGDLLRRPVPRGLAGYQTDTHTRVLADFSTQYGLTGNRARFIEGLSDLGLQAADARFIVCLRSPKDLARSYLQHISERRHVDLKTDRERIQQEVLSACDFRAALKFLYDQAGSGTAFVLKLEDVADGNRQADLFQRITTWLELPAVEDAVAVWANSVGSVGRYPRLIELLARMVRRTNFQRNMSPEARARIRNAFVRSGRPPALDPLDIEQILTEIMASDVVRDSQELLNTIETGPLATLGRLIPRENQKAPSWNNYS